VTGKMCYALLMLLQHGFILWCLCTRTTPIPLYLFLLWGLAIVATSFTLRDMWNTSTLQDRLRYYWWKRTHLKSPEKCQQCDATDCGSCSNIYPCRYCRGASWQHEADKLTCQKCGYQFTYFGIVLRGYRGDMWTKS
jgi:hypothetical protein